MIIVRSPLRITLGGGGTDLPAYYRHHGGFVMAAAINKYVYVAAGRPLVPGIYLKHSEIERVETIDGVQHRIIREALRLLEPGRPQIELTTIDDIPSGTGLGSSGSFTTALLRALYANRGARIDAHELAEQACHIEIDLLGEPIGKQDQYIAAFGGLTGFTFAGDGAAVAEPSPSTRRPARRLRTISFSSSPATRARPRTFSGIRSLDWKVGTRRCSTISTTRRRMRFGRRRRWKQATSRRSGD